VPANLLQARHGFVKLDRQGTVIRRTHRSRSLQVFLSQQRAEAREDKNGIA